MHVLNPERFQSHIFANNSAKVWLLFSGKKTNTAYRKRGYMANQKRVLLCCGAGMSSGFLATATELGLDWYVTAKSQSVAIDEMPDYDICLLGPHFRAHLDEFKEDLN